MTVRKRPGGMNSEIYKNYMDQELSTTWIKKARSATIYNFYILVSYSSEKILHL